MNSFTFFEEYHELIKYLNNEDRLQLYDAIFKYMFEDEDTEFNGLNKGIWINLKRPLSISKIKGNNGKIKKKSKQNQKEIKIKSKQNRKSSLATMSLSMSMSNVLLKEKGLLRGKIEEWLEYKKQRGDKPYTEIGFKKLLTQIENNVNKYGEQAIVELIDECMGNNYQGIIFDKLKGKRYQVKETTPDWLDKELKNEPVSEEDKKEMEELLANIENDISKIKG